MAWRAKETLYLDRRKNGFSLGSAGAIIRTVNEQTTAR